jgi:hypothetical protein
MDQNKPSSATQRRRLGLLDPFRQLWDVTVGLLLGWLGIALLGRRPPGCHTVDEDTPDGAYHGCGRALKYGVPRRFAPLCRECTVQQDSKGAEHVLCGIGNIPQFALPIGLFLPLASLMVVLVLGGGGLKLYRMGAFDAMLGKSGGASPPVTLERLMLGKELDQAEENAQRHPSPDEEAARAATKKRERLSRTATGAALAKEVELPPVPSAMERFRKVMAGPEKTTEVPEDVIVPKPITRVPASDLDAAKGADQ